MKPFISCTASVELSDGGRLHRLHDAAQGRASRMREEAIDDFWRGADALAITSLDSAQRSATRFAHRLAQHLRHRDPPPSWATGQKTGS